MKFGKSLSNQIEEALPEWRDKFLSYKELKKKLKLLEPKGGDRPTKRSRVEAAESTPGNGPNTSIDEKQSMSKEEIDFERLLENELEKFNTFFVEKEEEYIIRLKELQDRVAKAKDCNEEMMILWKETVDFHGEMVLLENYSALNYTGLVKILKKYDKRTGALIRLPFIQKVLQEPFFTTDLLNKLVKECEAMLERLFPMNDLQALTTTSPANRDDACDPAATSDTTKNDDMLRMPKEFAEIVYMKSLYMKSTISALRVLKEIRSGSSTVSVFSLPPLQTSGLEETWIKAPILEQAAK
ncbi:SPX domain-containing protein 1-like [Juglans microcarpa x Juglans regia]|uniref:SPX domain-containing protein 1-like n=1 Tax=Juglans microcarpa x Juglans regia TaxID=2249226 RepID=UPI001B7F6218|nr:SPX domain-containing protein 1-like [Juglans microcarpa x Juglans regia]